MPQLDTVLFDLAIALHMGPIKPMGKPSRYYRQWPRPAALYCCWPVTSFTCGSLAEGEG